MKVKTKKVYNDTYQVEVIFVNGGVDANAAWLKKKYKIEDGIIDKTSEALVVGIDFDSGATAYIMFFNGAKLDEKWRAVAVHESSHMAQRILSERGLKRTDDSEEAFAYFEGWVYEQAIKFLGGKR
jgi:hypothetical protein